MAAARNPPQPRGYSAALVLLTSLFFMWGLITSLNDILVPHLKAAFSLNYVQAMLIQFCFFGAYFVTSLPSGHFVETHGYKRGIILGLATAGLGCLLFQPAASQKSYPLFLGALFVLASGITLLQVAANPYVTILGPRQSAPIRLNLTQAFNSLGTTIGPYLGALFILSGGSGATADAGAVKAPYLVLAATLFVIALVMGLAPLPRKVVAATAQSDVAPRAVHLPHVWRQRHLLLGVVAIFLYVGAEVGIGSFLVNFMGLETIGSLPRAVAGKYLALYWGGAMVGRFVGSALMTRIRPATILAANALIAVLLIVIAIASAGHVAMWAMLAVGLFNSIMFPTIFALAIDGLGPHTGAGSGMLCMAIVGGAILPVAQGWMADSIGILYSFSAPLLCYLYIAFYGWKGHRHADSARIALRQDPESQRHG
jgi:FHS family L-fucose permease-like MFS transporter